MTRTYGRKARWSYALIALGTTALLLTGCTTVAGNTVETATPTPTEPAAIVEEHEHHDETESAVYRLTVNVQLTDDGIKPSTIFIPLGQSVQLVMRNRGTSEHHYEVLGLVPSNLLWVSRAETQAEIDLVMSGAVTTDDHNTHHVEDSNVSYRAASPAGIKPTGSEVHAYSGPGEADTVLFTATNAGTFRVICPLHPEMSAEVTVF